MFKGGLFSEIIDALSKHVLRTVLTGFMVAWGIYMLIMLLGLGKALRNGMSDNFKDDAINSIWIRAGKTSVPYHGYKTGRRIRMTNSDYEEINRDFEGVEFVTARHTRWRVLINRGPKGGTYSLRGVHPDHRYLEKTLVREGRFLNDSDIREKRKVIVIGLPVKAELFGTSNCIGEYVEVSGVAFKVVGVFEDEGDQGEERITYVPITAAQMVFSGADNIDRLMFTVGDMPLEESTQLAGRVRQYMADKHHFNPDDERAMRVRNNSEEFARVNHVLDMIEGYCWMIGILTLIAGIVGVSNIMLVVVSERTKELGIRKALGASPGSILKLIIAEAVIVTGFFGYLGLYLGIETLAALQTVMTEPPLLHPSVNLNTAIQATAILVISGTMAGLVPAIRAARVRPIVALREE